MDKNALRKNCLLLRKTLDKKKASEIIVSKIKVFETFLSAQNVLIFYPMKYEIDLLGLISSSKNFYLPKVQGEDIIICPYTLELQKSDFGVMEPVTSPIEDISIIDLAFIPALSIDKKLNRIGYGKGYYDRLFKNPKFKAQKIGVLYKELLVDSIEADSFDVKLDGVITD